MTQGARARAIGERSDRRLALGLAGLLAIAAAVLVGRALLGNEVLIATDEMWLREPWYAEQYVEGMSVSSALAGDTFDAWDPQRQLFADAVLDGDAALWNPYPSGGAPLAAEPSSGTYSPFQLVYLVFPDSYAPGVVKLLELAACAGFSFLFLRAVGLSRVAAVAGGAVYTFNGFQLVWSNWPQTRVGAMVPALFWAMERLLQRRNAAGVALTAAVVAMLIFDGFPAVSLAAIGAAAAYVVVRVVTTPSLRDTPQRWLQTLGLPAAGMGLGLGLTALQLLPFTARLPHLNLDRDQTIHAHFDSLVATTLGAPNAFGAPQEGSFRLPGNYVESLAYVGAAACVLALVGLARPLAGRVSPGVRLHAALGAVVAFVLMFVGGPLLAVAQEFPPLDTNNVGRLRALLAFFVAVLAALGVETVVSPDAANTTDDSNLPPKGADGGALRGQVRVWVASEAGRRWLRWGVTGGMVLVAVAVVGNTVRVARDRGYLGDAADDLLVAGIVAALSLAAVVVAARRAALLAPAVVVLGALVVGQGLSVWQPYLATSESDTWFSTTDMHRFLRDNLGHERVASAGSTLIAGSTARYGIRTVTGHVFTQPTWEDLLRAVDPAAFRSSPTYSYLDSTPEVATSPVLDRLGARYFATSERAAVLGVADLPDAASDAETATPVTLGPGDTATAELRAQRLRAVSVELIEPLTTTDRQAWLEIEVAGEDGAVVAGGSRRIHGNLGAGTITVPVAAEAATFDAPTELTATVSLAADDGEAVLATGGDEALAVGTVTGDDDLELVFDDHGQVYERSTALPRVRWHGESRVVPEAAERIELLQSGVPDDTVLLDDPDAPEAEGAADAEAEADVEIVHDGLDSVRVEVEAERAGYLVLADAVQIGWQAELDGEATELHHADHALGAVYVPEGRHVVEYRFRPERLGLGRAVSAVSAVVLAILVVVPAVSWVRRRRQDTGTPATSDGE